jgi:hypothetical protein
VVKTGGMAGSHVKGPVMGPKVYSLHAPEVECIGKGKPHQLSGVNDSARQPLADPHLGSGRRNRPF